MADDDEEAVVLTCKTLSCFIIIGYFCSQMKLISLLKRITAIITIHITNKVAYRTCRARGDGRVALTALVVTFCVVLWCAVLRLLYSMHDTARATFSYTKMHGLDSMSWRDVTQQVEFQLYLLTL